MCGIVGLFLREGHSYSKLGSWFEPMLQAMSERGPDSAGFAAYRAPESQGRLKYSLAAAGNATNWVQLCDAFREQNDPQATFEPRGNGGLLVTASDSDRVVPWIAEHGKGVFLLGVGKEMEIYKDVGNPTSVTQRFRIAEMDGSCMIGHTRMATESAINLEGSHPFTAGPDLSIVHNGSYANHNSLRDLMLREGISFESLNDTEVAAGFIQWRLEQGGDLRGALEDMTNAFSGFFTLAIGLRGQFAILRDRYACKPLVVAETEEYVACASEYRALAHLPGVMRARTFEPIPEEVYVWSH